MRRTALTLTAVVIAGLLLAGCTSSTPAKGSSSTTGSSSRLASGTINVFAAASLKEAFSKLGQQFEAAHPGVKVVFNFGASSGLATQITKGSPADVYASASTANMDQVVTAGQAASPKSFAGNVMEIAVPPGNPAGVQGLSDLAKPDLKVAACQATVPCGATATKIFSNAKLTVTPVSQEIDVKAVLTKVTLGEVDAGLVYVTDVRAAGEKVWGIEIPAKVNASTEYRIATLTKAPNKASAQAFTSFVLSAVGQSALTFAGFAKP